MRNRGQNFGYQEEKNICLDIENQEEKEIVLQILEFLDEKEKL